MVIRMIDLNFNTLIIDLKKRENMLKD